LSECRENFFLFRSIQTKEAFDRYIYPTMLVRLRDYQVQAVNDVRDSYSRGHRAPLVVLSTGAGKTVIFCDIVERVRKKENRVYVLVHRQELLRQTSKHLTKLGVNHGCIAPGHSMTGDAVQIASVQTLVRRLDQVKEPDLIIIDECHHSNAGTWRKIIDAWPNARLLGVTATPCRLDGRGLGVVAGGYYDTMIEGPSIRDLIDRGFLVQPLCYGTPVEVDLSGVSEVGGDFQQRELTRRVDKPKITGDAIDHYRQYCNGAPAIAFCASVEHAEHVAESFNAAGISAQSLTGKMADSVREYRINALATGGIKVLTSCDIISEGTDIPVVTVAILLRPTKSLGLYMQQVGRVLRPHPEKTNAIILDHAGNIARFGFPDDPRHWTLGNRPKPKKKKNQMCDKCGTEYPLTEDACPACGHVCVDLRIRQCGSCFAIYPASKATCPQCGSGPMKMGRQLKHEEGQLVLLTKENAMREKKAQRIEVARAGSLEELLLIAKNRGYDYRWAYRIWEARTLRNGVREEQMVCL
jgi:DNA repair protein RadD